jgi:hypothetical protein
LRHLLKLRGHRPRSFRFQPHIAIKPRSIPPAQRAVTADHAFH